MKIRTAKVKALAAVRSMSGCVNFGCMAIRGEEAWGLKTNEEQNLSILYYCRNVNFMVSRHYEIRDLLGHGNGMTRDADFLYFGCALVDVPPQEQNRYILRVPRDFRGDLRDAVRITTPTPVASLSYYKKDHIIATVRSDVPGYRKFGIGKITVDETAKSGSMEYVSFIYVKLDTTDFIKQDIFFDRRKRLLFLPQNRRDAEGRILVNRIFIVNLAGPRRIMNGARTFEPVGVIAIDKDPQEGYTKFEVESLGLDSARRIVFAANARGKMEDHFFRITNLKF